MGLSREQAVRFVAVSALFTVPLLCAAFYFLLEAPGQDPGVYLETGDGMYQLSGYPADQAGTYADGALKTPVVPGGPALAFYTVGSPGAPLVAKATSSTLWCFAVDNGDPRFRPRALPVTATIQQINPRAYRITSEELKKEWGPESLAFQTYQRALASTAGSRTTIEVMIGLEVQDSANGPRRMYAVRMGPPR